MATTKKAAQDKRPHKTFGAITQLGLKAFNLAAAHSVEVTPRLPDPSVVTVLGANLVSLGVIVPAALNAQTGSKQATATQNSVLTTAYEVLTAMRGSVKRKRPPHDVALAYAVGERTNPALVKDVKAALTKIRDRAQAHPAEAQAFGIIAADVQTLTDHISAVDAADQAQEKARASAPQTTKARNALARSILDAVDAVASAGIIAFAHDKTTRQNFESLVQKVS